MTDRVRTLTILLKDDVRTDDAKEFASLLRMLGPVADVKLGPELDMAHWQALVEARRATGKQIANLLRGRHPDDES